MNCVRGFAGQAKTQPCSMSERLPEQGAFFVRQCDKFIEAHLLRVVSAEDMGQLCVTQRIHQRGGLADLARILSAWSASASAASG